MQRNRRMIALAAAALLGGPALAKPLVKPMAKPQTEAPVPVPAPGPALLDLDATARTLSGRCTLENGLPVFRGDAAATSALADAEFFDEAHHFAIQAVADGTVRGQIDNDALENIDIDEIARGMVACNGPATMLRSKSQTDLRYIVFDEASLASYPIAGVTPAQLRLIAGVHEYGHVYARRAGLERLAETLGGDPDRLGEGLADAYMLLRLKSRDAAMAAPVDAFLRFRHTLEATDKLHVVMPSPLKAQLEAEAARLRPDTGDRDVFAIAARVFAASLTPAKPFPGKPTKAFRPK